MTTRFYFLITCLFLPLVVTAQVQLERFVVAGGGTFLSGPGINLAMTIGEPGTTTLTGSTAILTQGFHQPDPLFVGLTDQMPWYSLQVYPNPVMNDLVIEVLSTNDINLSVTLYDITGRVVLSEPGKLITSNVTSQIQLNLASLNPAVYVVQLTDRTRGMLLRSIQIIKTI